MQTIESKPDKWQYVIGPYSKPIATVQPGEVFTIETADAFGNTVDSADVDLSEVLDPEYSNPTTGPIYVEGAEPGDTLAVTIHHIEPTRDYGVSVSGGEFGGLCPTPMTRMLNPPLPTVTMLHPIRDGMVTFSDHLPIAPIPLEPFYGTIGTSRRLDAITTEAPGSHGGNMDVPDVGIGSTLYLPVKVPGALLFVGDGHAAQGDGEVCGSAVEIPTRGTLSVDLIKGQSIDTPRLETDDFLMTVGNARPMEDAARIAYYELVMWLEADYGIDRMTGYRLCSFVGQVRLGNMVDPLYSVGAKFPKKYLPGT
jgi:acetamidase/formamidase